MKLWITSSPFCCPRLIGKPFYNTRFKCLHQDFHEYRRSLQNQRRRKKFIYHFPRVQIYTGGRKWFEITQKQAKEQKLQKSQQFRLTESGEMDGKFQEWSFFRELLGGGDGIVVMPGIYSLMDLLPYLVFVGWQGTCGHFLSMIDRFLFVWGSWLTKDTVFDAIMRHVDKVHMVSQMAHVSKPSVRLVVFLSSSHGNWLSLMARWWVVNMLPNSLIN